MSSSTPYIVDDDQLFVNDTAEPEQHPVGGSEQGDETPIKPSSSKIKDYTLKNFLGFVFACFSAISFTVFLTATQTYFMTDVLGVSDNLGSYIGTLGFYDELLAIALVPVLGTLSDRIGSRPIQVVGVSVIGLSFFGYGAFARSVYPGMLFWRLVFCVGAASCTSTMMVMLIELNNSNFNMWGLVGRIVPKGIFSRGQEEPVALPESSDASDEEPVTQEAMNKINRAKKEGRTSSFIGAASGLGAIFAVLFYLRLPVYYGTSQPAKEAMAKSYYTVGIAAIITAAILFFALYKDDRKRIFKDDIEELFDGLEDEEEGDQQGLEPRETYLMSLKTGFKMSIKNPVILMSYMGSFMARVTTIMISIFIPFYVNNYYFKSGQCSTHEVDKVHCRESYILASILTGVSQAFALLAAPFVGTLIDRMNNHAHVLLMTNTMSMVAALGMSLTPKPDESKLIFAWVIVLGMTQIGFIIVSMTMLSNINSHEKYYKYKGSISGVYSLFGGIGILVTNKLGGWFGDWFVTGPFVILFLCNVVFFVLMYLLKGAKENDQRSLSGVLQKLKDRFRRQ